jgi:protein-tyrosine phosphatase
VPNFTSQVQAFFQTAKAERRPEPAPGQAPELRNIAFVCTGNVCRSAFAHHALEIELLRRSGTTQPFHVASAGLGALVGSPMEPQMAAEFRRRFGRVPAHRAQQIDEAFVAGAGLLLVMTRDQRHGVLHQYPQSAQRCFLFSEFLAILESAPVSEPLEFSKLVSYAHSHRMMARGNFPDIEDPYRRSPETHQRVAEQLTVAVRTLADRLTR